MDKFIKYVKENWEIAVLAVVCLLAIISCVVFFCGGSEEELATASSRQKLERQRALSVKAFDFLNPKKFDCSRNPFALAVKKPEPPKPKPKPTPPPVQPKKVEEKLEATQPQEAPKQEAAPVKEVVVEKPTGPKIIAGTFEFVFQRRNSDGKAVAVVKAHRRGDEPAVFTVGVGEGVLGVKVLAISEERIGLQDARGQRGTIPLGEKRNIWFVTD